MSHRLRSISLNAFAGICLATASLMATAQTPPPYGLSINIDQAKKAMVAAEAEARGVRKLIAVIGDSGNAGSVGVHRACGFTPAGLIRSCGWKFGRWLDVVLMQRPLGPGHTSPPRKNE